MPRVDIPLSGWTQTPDEHGGAPRVARLTNCRLENQGRIARSPGRALIPTTNDGSLTIRPLTMGPDFAIYQQAINSPVQPGFRLGKLIGNSWSHHAATSDYLSPVEAPVLKRIFSDEGHHYLHCGVLDCGNGDLVIYAERSREPLGLVDTGDYDDAPLDTTIVWALLSGASCYEPVKYGSIVTSNGAYYTYPTSDGPFLVCLKGSYIMVRRWNTTTRDFDLTIDGLSLGLGMAGVGGNMRAQIDVAYSPQVNALFVALETGRVWMVNATTGALIYYYDVTPFISGALAICVVDSAWFYSGTPSPVLLIVYQHSATSWAAVGLNIITVGVLAGSVGTLIYTSAGNIPNASGYWAAKIPGICFGGSGFHCVLPCSGVGESSQVVCVIDYNTSTHVISPVSTSAVLPCRISATKPIHDVNNGAVFWTYDASTTRSLRDLELSGIASVAGNKYGAKTIALLGGNPGIAPMPHYQEPRGPMVRATNLGPSLTGSTERRTGWVAAVMVQKTATSRMCDVYMVSACDAYQETYNTYLLNHYDVGQVARMRGVTYVASGMPLAYETAPDVTGYFKVMAGTITEAAGTGVWVPNGETHTVVAALKYVSPSGRVIWGPVSDPLVYHNTSGVTKDATAYFFYDDDTPQHWKATLHYFEELNGTFYEIHTGLAPATIYSTADMAAYASKPIVYTQGANGAVSGQLDHFGCPPCRTIWAGRNRVLCGGLANDRQVHWSTIAFPTEALAWPQNAAFKAEVDERVTAVAALDDLWFVFSERSIWVITGQGPDNMGNGTFEDPLRISTGIGCVSWRSVVETPMGLMFQANNGQIYLIPRGSPAPTMVSQAIRDSLTSNYRNDADLHEQWIIGAVYDPLCQEVWFSTHYRDWVLQLDTLAWRQEQTTYSYCRSASYFESSSIGVTGYAGPVIVRNNAMVRLRRRDTDSYVYEDEDDTPRRFSIETNDIDLGSHGRFRRGWLRVFCQPNFSSTASETWMASIWYDGKERTTTDDETVTLWGYDANLDANTFTDLEFCPARQKCNQVRVKITAGDGQSAFIQWDVVSLALDLVPSKDSPVKVNSGNGRLK